MLKILIITKKTGSAGKHAVVLRHTIEQINRHKKEMNTFLCNLYRYHEISMKNATIFSLN